MIGEVAAEPITLKCFDSSGLATVDLSIDLDTKIITWGVTTYYITGVTDTYISAYEETDAVGGEVWVINRITGDYKRATVGIFYSSAQARDGGAFKALIYSSRCSKQQF